MVTEFLSLDGVMEEPVWSLSYWNDSIAKFKKDELFASGAHLLGRVTYRGLPLPGLSARMRKASRIT